MGRSSIRGLRDGQGDEGLGPGEGVAWAADKAMPRQPSEQGVRVSEVSRLKAAIAAGSYRVSSFQLAESVLQYMLLSPST